MFRVVWVFICLLVGSLAADPGNCADNLLWERRVISPAFQFNGEAVRVACFDAHRTLYVTQEGTITPQPGETVRLLPGVVEGLVKAEQSGYFIAIFSNQPHIDVDVSNQTLRQMAQEIARRGGRIHYWDFPGVEPLDHPDFKPSGGMALRLGQLIYKRFGVPVDWGRSFMVGDQADAQLDGSAADAGFAKTSGAFFIDPSVYFKWRELGARRFGFDDQ